MINWLTRNIMKILGRLAYVAVGVLLATMIMHQTVGLKMVGDVLIPNLPTDQIEECLDYFDKNDLHYGQICYFDDGYIYALLPWDTYIETIEIGCSMLLDKNLENFQYGLNNTMEARHEGESACRNHREINKED